MDEQVYNTIDGIATMLGTHKDFDALLNARREAGLRHESLETFYVLGRYFLDSMGYVYPLSRETFNDVFRSKASAVMDETSFFAYMRACGIENGAVYTSANALPPAGVNCDTCGKSWTYPDLDDCIADSDVDVDLDYSAHVGKSLAQLADELNAKGDGAYSANMQVRNDRWRKATGRRSEREGWRTDESDDVVITPAYVIQAGDQCVISVVRYRHNACQAQAVLVQKQAELQGTIMALTQAFSTAGFRNVKVESAPLPPHLIEMIRGGEELEPEEIEQAKSELPYLQVASDEGTLFLFMASMPTIDLKGSGLTVRDLDPFQADQLDQMKAAGEDVGIYDTVAGFHPTVEGLCELRMVLERKKAATPTA